MTPIRHAFCLAALLLATCLPAVASDLPLSGGPYVPTPQRVVDEMLKIAGVGAKDTVIDLGSGDGRIVLTAVQKHGARGRGYDIDARLVERSNATAKKLGIEGRASFHEMDVLKAPIGDATVITLYLLPEMMRALRSKFLKELKPGTRIVSHDFDFGDWKPERSVNLELEEKYDSPGRFSSNIFLWVVPERSAQ
ncbi:MAG: class I SAM-dependent methyltransferase [Betaproteobacteria bacterium]|jgi:ubiquinone/menaquinone biosynthesis C-methylase UbiE|nr:class I SAM-dependent methyltransferase [Betaproteobacteria bacterium]